MVGIIQEQHPDRARLFMQWKQMGWPIMVDSLDLLETTVVPLTLAIDEYGVIREVQPRRDRLDEFRASFVDATFAPPGPAAETGNVGPVRPGGADRAAVEGSAGGRRVGSEAPIDVERLRERAVSRYLWGDEAQIDAVVEAFEQAVAADPQHGYTLFRAGVAHRRRYESTAARPGDFRRAVSYWQQALEVDPNNYIWRRRIQQYGPRLDKPYPFYDWVPIAREEITARGETPVPLSNEPGGAELADPLASFVGASGSGAPAIDARILRDVGRFVSTEVTMVPSRVAPGGSVRAHVAFTPNHAIEAHWNNEVDDLVFRIDPPGGWQVDRRSFNVRNPAEVVSRETRRVEVEIRAPDGVDRGRYTLSGYALYYVCEDINGVCLYRRQDVDLVLEVR